MRIIGCDLHARQQTVAMLETTTGELVWQKSGKALSPGRPRERPTRSTVLDYQLIFSRPGPYRSIGKLYLVLFKLHWLNANGILRHVAKDAEPRGVNM